MKRDLLIIGFYYENNKEYKPISGLSVDMFHVHKYFSSPDCKVNILTDVQDPMKEHQSGIGFMLRKGIVTTELASFLDNKKETKLVLNKQQFLESLKKIEITSKRLVIYFSGHSSDGNIILPHGEEIPFSELISIMDKKGSGMQIMTIFDCCYPDDLNLKFTLKNKQFVLHGKNKIKNEIVLLCSSSKNQISLAKESGSFFTYYLIDFLKEIKKNNRSFILHELKDGVTNLIKKETSRNNQTVSVYSNSFDDVLWSWVVLDVDIRVKNNSLYIS